MGAQLPKNPVPEAAGEKLQKLMGWLFGQAKQGREHVIKSQNPDLGKLVRVLAEPRALASLNRDRSLRLAFEEVEPPSYRFEETLKEAAITAERTLGLSSHFDPSSQSVLMETVEKLAVTVRNLRNAMRQKAAPDDDL